MNEPRRVTVRRHVLSALAWGIFASVVGMVLAMATGAFATRLDGHGLGLLGAMAAMFSFLPGAWLGWRLAHRPWFFWTGIAVVIAGIVAANLWKSWG